jgi:3'(2'),5'-bisphosphate nucleotidase
MAFLVGSGDRISFKVRKSGKPDLRAHKTGRRAGFQAAKGPVLRQNCLHPVGVRVIGIHPARNGFCPGMDAKARNDLASHFGAMASEAGRVIMLIYSPALRVTAKADGSPVTDADTGSERAIRARLSGLMPDVPILAEESFAAGTGPMPGRFFLVDPLDGTREFMSGSDEFTVNIALIEEGAPIAGCVYAPALNQMYLAGAAAFRAELRPGEIPPRLDAMDALATRAYPAQGLCAVASRSHMDAESEALLQRLPVIARKSAGSSLKFCLIAQGDSDIYPRLAPTMEWDTAAGQAVLTAAGGCVIGRDGSSLRYGKADKGFRNDGFVAWGRAPMP